MDEEKSGPQSPHRLAWDLIPWVVNGSASEDERRSVEAHRLQCADCRDEFEFQQRLFDGMAGPRPGADAAPPQDLPDAEQALQRFWGGVAPAPLAAHMSTHTATHTAAHLTVQLAAQLAANKPLGRWSQPRWQRALIAAVVVQALGLAAALGYIGLGAGQDGRPAAYEVLSEPAAAAPGRASIRLVPAPGLQMGELRALLARSDLHVVQASVDAAYLGLALAPGARFSAAQALQRLRAEPGVLLAEATP
ncbi:hypothetical protein BH11PSE10_BH11PSE10_18040 [soil metagenome]